MSFRAKQKGKKNQQKDVFVFDAKFEAMIMVVHMPLTRGMLALEY